MEKWCREKVKQVFREGWNKRSFVFWVGVVLAAVQMFGNITLCKAAQLDRGDGAIQVLSAEPFPKILQDVSPDGKELLLVTWDSIGTQNLWVYDLETKNLCQLTFKAKTAWPGRFDANGSKVVYMGAQDQILTIPTKGGNSTVIYSKSSAEDGFRNPCWSPDGKKILAAGILASENLPWGLYLFDLEKNQWEFLEKSESGTLAGYPNFSPDGTKIAYAAIATTGKEKANLYIFSLADKTTSKVDTHGIVTSVPAWSPDGKWIAFSGWMPGENNCQIYIVPANGLGDPIQVTKDGIFNYVRWTPDGKKILFTAPSSERQGNTVFSIDVSSLILSK